MNDVFARARAAAAGAIQRKTPKGKKQTRGLLASILEDKQTPPAPVHRPPSRQFLRQVERRRMKDARKASNMAAGSFKGYESAGPNRLARRRTVTLMIRNLRKAIRAKKIENLGGSLTKAYREYRAKRRENTRQMQAAILRPVAKQ